MILIFALVLPIFSIVEGTDEINCSVFSIPTACPELEKLENIKEEYGHNTFPSESFLDEHCSTLIDIARCMRPYAPCGIKEDHLKLLVDPFVGGAIDKLVQLCDKSSNLRRAYHENAECINEHILDFDYCAPDRQIPWEFENYLKSKGVYAETQINANECLSIALSLNCIGFQLGKSCGYESFDLFIGLLSGIERIFNEACPPEITGPGVSLYMEFIFSRDQIVD